jgi:glycerophosphoryl diester phosphodiesterase
MSFSATSLRRVHVMAPTIPTVYLMEHVPLRLRDGSLPTGCAIAGPSLDILRAHPRYVERVHAQGNRLHVWTVDEPADIDYVLGLGVDAVISNHPRRVLRRLDRA